MLVPQAQLSRTFKGRERTAEGPGPLAEPEPRELE